MPAKYVIQGVFFVLLACGGIGVAMFEHQWPERAIFYAMALVGVVGIIKAEYLAGWVGRSPEEVARELKRLEAISETWTLPDGSTVPLEERRKISNRMRKLEGYMSEARAMGFKPEK